MIEELIKYIENKIIKELDNFDMMVSSEEKLNCLIKNYILLNEVDDNE